MIQADRPLVGIVMGSTSDLEVMKGAADILQMLGIPCEMKVASAHRTPALVHRYATTAADRGLEAIIAGAGAAAHLAGVIASLTLLPVIGVPLKGGGLEGLDALLSTVQMPPGVPVATVGIGNAKNAAFLAARILAPRHPEITARLIAYVQETAQKIEAIQL